MTPEEQTQTAIQQLIGRLMIENTALVSQLEALKKEMDVQKKSADHA